MSNGSNPNIDLADACAAQADQLQQLQKQADYTGPNIASLYASEMALRNKVLLLNTAAMGTALAANAGAQTQLNQATASAKAIAQTIQTVQKALQIAADLMTLAAGVVSDNPASVISAAGKLVSDATSTPSSAGSGTTSGGSSTASQ